MSLDYSVELHLKQRVLLFGFSLISIEKIALVIPEEAVMEKEETNNTIKIVIMHQTVIQRDHMYQKTNLTNLYLTKQEVNKK